MRTTNKSLRGIAGKPKRGFKGKAAALLASAAMGLGACGDTIHNHYYESDGGTPTVNVEAPDVTVNLPSDTGEASPLCSEDGLSPAHELTLNIGESALLRNGFRLEFTDIEAGTQTAFFHLTDEEGNLISHVDLVEGAEVRITLDDSSAAIVACSVRAGYTFGERSVTLVSDSVLEMGEPEQPPSICEGDIAIETTEHIYTTQIPGATQEVQLWYCDGEDSNFRETSAFSPDIELELGESGYPTGLPPGRYTVSVLGEDYVLADADQGGIALAKESISGIMNQGETLPVDDLRIRLDDLEAHGEVAGAIISVLDSLGNVLVHDVVNPGQTVSFMAGAREYLFHVYETAPGYTFGAKWADVAVFSEYHGVEDGGSFGGFSFDMNWTIDRRLSGWTLTRE